MQFINELRVYLRIINKLFMKRLFLLAALGLSSFMAIAQFKTIAKSSSFPEPETGFFKILKDPSGATIVLHDVKSDIQVKKYDASKKLVFSKNIKLPFKSHRKIMGNTLNQQNSLGNVTTVFTTQTDLVYISSYLNGRVPTLERVIINLETGALKESKEIALLDKINTGSGMAMVYGNVPYPEFYVKKDPQSDNYAVVAFNSFESDRSKRIHVSLYDANHEKVSEAYYPSPGEGYKYMEVLDLYVDGNKGVSVLTSGMNTASSGGEKTGGMFIGTLKPNASTIDIAQLPVENGGAVYSAVLRYNPVADKMFLLMHTATRTKKNSNKYYVDLATFNKDRSDFQIKPVNIEPINTIAKTQFKRREKMEAIPQAMYMNKDGSVSLILEEIEIVVTTRSNSSFAQTSYYLKDMGVLKYDVKGNLIAAQYIPKAQKTNYAPTMKYYAFREDIAFPLTAGTQYKSFSYVNAPNQGYLLYNDIAANQAKMKAGKKMTMIQSVKDCEGYYFSNSDKGIPAGNKVIPSDKKSKNLLLFAAAYYDEVSNELIVLNRPKGNGKKGAEILWLQPE